MGEQALSPAPHLQNITQPVHSNSLPPPPPLLNHSRSCQSQLARLQFRSPATLASPKRAMASWEWWRRPGDRGGRPAGWPALQSSSSIALYYRLAVECERQCFCEFARSLPPPPPRSLAIRRPKFAIARLVAARGRHRDRRGGGLRRRRRDKIELSSRAERAMARIGASALQSNQGSPTGGSSELFALANGGGASEATSQLGAKFCVVGQLAELAPAASIQSPLAL